ncbi:hypothetical protein [Reyranella sp.]|uniref:hypothetical protein n=1 Tax=Reyranella sp. TaxID=1929291 RepID=UPI003783F508
MNGAQDTVARKDITTLMDEIAVSIAYAHERVRLHDLKVGIARTQPPYGDEPGIQEGRHASSVGGQSSRW